ncbi:unnamed protein product [Gongylonema pulchrum]|uniref:Craniofacial development protein 1 n=1 Tax=Gongylonema pulchrum TaxID=637853 RepID=A0A183EBJ7_9BILA|nr:unnamed protein product [Gongylonema pulchrum]
MRASEEPDDESADEEYEPSSSDEEDDVDEQGHEEVAAADEGEAESEEQRRSRLEGLFQEFIAEGAPIPVATDLRCSSNARTTHFRASTSGFRLPNSAGIGGPRSTPASSSTAPMNARDVREGDDQPPKAPQKKRCSSSLPGAISSLSKKPKMSILDKTAKDWGAFKSETGIQEELLSHNRGKNGYMERLEFLNRADYRQFEKERDARNAARKNN